MSWRQRGLGAALVTGTVVLVTGAAAGPVAAEDPQPFARSAATTYQVTFAARSCPSYAEVTANQVRDDAAESPGRPGKDSSYKPGQPVDPDIEARDPCDPLPGARFTLGSGRDRKGALSTVTGAAEPVTVAAESPRLDPTGQPSGGPLRGSVTVTLTDEQVRLAGRRQLWVQGGTPQAPVPGGHAFAVLRCAVDGRSGGNVQWVAFPSGIRHVFCYAYYVRGATATATIAVKLRTTRPAGYPQRIGFQSSLSQAGSFALTAESAETSFVRLPGEAHRLQPQLPAGWRLADVSCAASKATADPATGRAEVTLIAGENAVCSYAVEPPAAPPGLTVRAYAEGGAGTFNVKVAAANGTEYALTAAPRGDGSPVTASGADLSALAAGTYTVTTAPPAAEANLWSLAGAACNGAPVTVQGWVVRATVGASVPTECVLRLARKQGSIALRAVTTGGVATAGFALVPAEAAATGWGAAATTSQPGAPAAASGDVPASLAFGGYLLVPLPPLATVDASWRLTTLGCQPGNSGGPQTRALRVDLAANAAAVECTATYQMVPASRLRLEVRAEGGSARGPVAVEVDCADGSAGRVVLPADSDGPFDLPQPLTFSEPSNCTVSVAEDAERPLNASLVVESAPGNAPLALPATVALGEPGSEMRLAVTLTYGGAVADDDEGTKGGLRSFRILPVALIGSGLIGIGAAVLLVLVARRRMGLDDD